VCFEMGCQLVDASCEQSHLDFGATRVIGSASIGLDDLSLDSVSQAVLVGIRSLPWFGKSP